MPGVAGRTRRWTLDRKAVDERVHVAHARGIAARQSDRPRIARGVPDPAAGLIPEVVVAHGDERRSPVLRSSDVDFEDFQICLVVAGTCVAVQLEAVVAAVQRPNLTLRGLGGLWPPGRLAAGPVVTRMPAIRTA